jgi:hypothetical protein
MRRNIFWLGMLVMILAFGITVVSCGGGDDDTHTHQWGAWQSNAAQHWKECSCGEEYGRANHTGRPCSVCGYSSGSGETTALDGTWRRGNSARYYQIKIEGNTWIYSEGPEGNVKEYSKGTWSSNTAIAAPSTGTLTLTVTQISDNGSTWVNLPPEYNNVKTNTAAYSIDASGITLTISNAALTTSGVWGTLEGVYQKQGGSSNTAVDGTWRRDSGSYYYQIKIDGNNWIFYDSAAEFCKGTWTSNPTIAAPSTGTLTLTITQIPYGGSWINLPSEYNSVKTNTATFQLNASGNTLTLSNSSLTHEIWSKLEGVYQKQGGSNFVAVTNITGVPTAATAGTALALTSTVEPSNATNKTIVWSVVSGSASVSGSTLNPTGAGTVTVRATITNGTAQGTNYTKDFNITVNSSSSFVAVTNITEVPTAATVGTALSLTGTVEPAAATNKTIIWSVVSGSASVSGSTLNPTGAGTVTVRATITNGTAQGTNYTQNFTITVNNVPFPENGTLAEKLAWVENANNVQNGEIYTIEVNANEEISPQTLSYTNRSNITIILKGIGTEKVVSLSSNGCLFTVASGVTLVLDENITLQGKNNNSEWSLVRINSGGTLEMKEGSKITGNQSGGGIYVSNATFTMSGGEISGNTTYSAGGGVYINSGTFTMTGGVISGNTAINGGGVFVRGSVAGNGIFTMNGGVISGNTAISNSFYHGGGVFVDDNTYSFFRIANGTVYGSNADEDLRNTATPANTLSRNGAALYKGSNGIAQRGTLGGANGTTWTSKANLSTTDNTIKVVNGDIVP